MGKLSEVPRFLVATRLQTLCGKPHQLAKVLRGEDGKEAQIPGTKNVLWRAFLDTPLLPREGGDEELEMSCSIPGMDPQVSLLL